jgi:hypothetical protein
MPVEFIKVTPGKTARVRITGATRLLGQHVEEGRVVEVPEEEAHALIMAQKAEWYTEPVPAKAK